MGQKLRVLRMSPEHLPVVDAWYRKKGKELPSHLLGDSKGFIVSSDDALVACGFLIETKAKFCLLEFIETNPELPRVTQSRGYALLIHAMIDIVKLLGFKVIMGFVPEDNTSVKRYYKRIGGHGQAVTAFAMEV